MDKLLPNIFNVYRDPQCKGFGHSYLLKRKAGNILLPRFGTDTTIQNEYEAIEKAGGIDLIFITDYHFGGSSTETLAKHFGAEVMCSAIEKPKLKKKGLNTVTTFTYERQSLGDDLEIIPTPGHTSGGVCLLWHNAKNKHLFTGDFLYFNGQTWVPGAKTKSKIEASLNLLKDLDYHHLIGCGSDGVNTPYMLLKTKKQKTEFIGSVLASFKK